MILNKREIFTVPRRGAGAMDAGAGAGNRNGEMVCRTKSP